MLSAVLRSDIAVRVSIQIMNAFVAMRQQLPSSDFLISRIIGVEKRQQFTDKKVNELFEKMEKHQLPAERGVFFNGEIFDAYKFAINLIKKADKEIVLIDNYVDETTLIMLSHRKVQVSTKVYTSRITAQLKLTHEKHMEQFPGISLHLLPSCHDRFLIIDNLDLFHIGASLKDLRKKWFAFSKMNDFLPALRDKLV